MRLDSLTTPNGVTRHRRVFASASRTRPPDKIQSISTKSLAMDKAVVDLAA